MWIKICGLTTPEQAEMIVPLQPAAVGLNFYHKSIRGITPEQACLIGQQIPPSVLKVGVFVEQSPAEILDIARLASLDLIQLHGQYSPQKATQLNGHPFIWVHRLGTDGLEQFLEELTQLQALKLEPFACLIDAQVPGHYGGSGKTVDWDLLAQYYDCRFPPLILAGGLHPDNVAQAIQAVRPWGVDVASGVEISGQKDLEKCRRFIEQARMAPGNPSPTDLSRTP